MVCEDVVIDNLRRLAAAVINQAVRDLMDDEQHEDAKAFLMSADFMWWAEWAGYSFLDPFKVIESPVWNPRVSQLQSA